MKTFRLVLIFALFLLVWPVLAFAGEIVAAEVSGLNSFVDNTLQPLILSLLGTVLTIAITYVTALLKRKFGIEISEATANRLRGIAWDAVQSVEERAVATVKEGGRKWLSTAKHAAAVDYILAKAPALTREEADALVQSAVAKVKGIGATAQLGN